MRQPCCYSQTIIEGFGGNRALGFLLKTELKKTLQISHAVLFTVGALNNVLYEGCFVFDYVCKKPVFVVTSAHEVHKDGNFT